MNLGSGDHYAQGYLNVDLTHPGADVNCDITLGLPFTDEPITRIYAGHVLEHLPLGELPDILRAWREDPNVYESTELAIVGPDCDRADAMFLHGLLDTEDLRLIRDGGGRWVGDEHLWRSTESGTLALLWESWKPRVVSPLELMCHGWPVTSLASWQFAIVATP